MSTRTQRLRERTLESVHKQARIVMPDWDVSDLPLSLPERKASAIAIILERMPLYIGEEELIVGTRTVYGYPGEDSDDKSFFDYNALPHYVNEKTGNILSWTRKPFRRRIMRRILGFCLRKESAESSGKRRSGWRMNRRTKPLNFINRL